MEHEFLEALDDLAESSVADQCTGQIPEPR